MRILLVFVALCSAAAIVACGADSAKNTDYLFIVSAPSGSMHGTKLTLNNVPSILYFSDRPKRDVGHITVDRYVAAWTPASDKNFDPPNADLALLGPDGTTNAVVELESVSGDTSALTFEVKVLEGTLVEGELGPVALFVDTCDISYPLCKPL